ncbi:MAG: hypothetical protein AAGB31_14900 [Bdellovibrio sp.]
MKKIIALVSILLGAASALAHRGPHHPPVPPTSDVLCATAYASAYRSEEGPALPVYSGTAISDLNRVRMPQTYNNWDNKISLVVVEPGCKFVGYQYQNYNVDYRSGEVLRGFKVIVDNTDSSEATHRYLGHYKDDRISSLKCQCAE